MTAANHLEAALAELASTIGPQWPLTVGGGFGLYLRQTRRADRPGRTVLPLRDWPPPRSTKDLDLFVSVELFADPREAARLAETLYSCGYAPVEPRKYWQWARPRPHPQGVVIDLLIGPLGVRSADFKKKGPRVRPKPAPDPQVHAHRTPEALEVDTTGEEFVVTGAGGPARVRVPAPHTYLLMKLPAFADRHHDRNDPPAAARHASDVFRTVAMMTEPEFAAASLFLRDRRDAPEVARARQVAREEFAGPTSHGLLSVRSGPTPPADEAVETFIAAIGELFEVP